MPGRITELSESQIVADLLKDRRRQAAATTSIQIPQPAKDTFTVASTPATTYTLNAIPYQGTGGSSLNLSLNGVELLEGVDYTVDYTTAIVTVSATLKGTPTPPDVLTADYWTTGDLIALTGPVNTGGVTDNFNRADSAISLGVTSDGFYTWQAISGTWGITSNQGYMSVLPGSGDGIAVVNAGVADCTISINSINWTSSARNFGGLAFRVTDASNYWMFIHNPSSPGSADGVWKTVAGVQTRVISLSVVNSFPFTIVLAGSSITAQAGGATVGTATDGFNQTATKHGLACHDITNTFDDFTIVSG